MQNAADENPTSQPSGSGSPSGERSERAACTYSIVTTCYNEAANIDNLVGNLLACFQQHFPDESFELVVVLNGPTDETPVLARALAAKHPELRLVELAVNQGYGGGIRAGLAAAGGEFIGYVDGDEQVLAPDVARVFAAARQSESDIVKVVRVKREDGFSRLVITSVYNVLFRLLFGFFCLDVNGKPKVLKRSALEKLALTSRDWFIDAELMITAHNVGMTIEEIPVTFHQREGGTSNVRMSTIFEFLQNMWAYKRRPRR
jgi:dolichol-phosphate mannosyltransferase